MKDEKAKRAETTSRDVARRVLDRVDKGAWATLALDGELDRSGLEDRDRRLASELVYGVLRNRARIDRAIAAHAELKRTPPRVVTALRVAAYQLSSLDRVPSYRAVDDASRAARARRAEGRRVNQRGAAEADDGRGASAPRRWPRAHRGRALAAALDRRRAGRGVIGRARRRCPGCIGGGRARGGGRRAARGAGG